MNRALKRISIAILAMFLLLLINVNYLQGFETSSLAAEKFNARTFDTQFQYQRGPITTSDGMTIAASKPSKDVYKFQRYYPGGAAYAPITGYDTLYSSTGIEHTENAVLNGSSSSLAFRNLIDMITSKPRKGANVQLTINSKAQQAAYAGLAASGHTGGAVAINPQTGAILAMATYPSYDPNQLAVHDGNQLIKNDNALLGAADQPLLDRATQETYPPGSTFKIITSSTYFARNAANSPQSMVYSPTTLKLPQTTNVLRNDNDSACGDGSGHTTLITAFTESCDTTFGNLGMNLGGQALKNMADGFGFNNSDLAVPMPVTSSNYVVPPSAPLTAFSAIGQFSDTVTPMQEAMLAATIAHGGTLMRPYLVQQVIASDLSVVDQATPSVLSTPISPAIASNVTQMMISVVNSPDGTAAGVPGIHSLGVQVAGKTGTAQNGINNTGLSDAVFTCFAPANNPTIAVGVIVKGGGFGAAAAAPIAVSIIKAYLGIR